MSERRKLFDVKLIRDFLHLNDELDFKQKKQQTMNAYECLSKVSPGKLFLKGFSIELFLW